MFYVLCVVGGGAADALGEAPGMMAIFCALGWCPHYKLVYPYLAHTDRGNV